MPIEPKDVPHGFYGTLVESATRPIFNYTRPPTYWTAERKQKEKARIEREWEQRNADWVQWCRDQRERYGYADPGEVE